MIQHPNEARAEMYALIKASFPAGTKIYYFGADPGVPPEITTPYLFAVVRHADGDRTTLAGDGNKRRYDRVGVVMLQCYYPGASKNPLGEAMNLATIAQRAFEAARGCVKYRNRAVREIGKDERGFYQANFTCTFVYDEIH